MAFATSADVGTLLLRALTNEEAAAALLVIDIVTGQITTLAGRDAEWAEALDPVPGAIRAVCIGKAAMAITNPQMLFSLSNTLGAFSSTEQYPRSAVAGIALSDAEQNMVTDALYGSAASAPVTSAVDTLIDYAEDGRVTP